MSDFVHLHTHTHYSLLDGKSSPQALLNRAKELGQNSLAISDHGQLGGVPEFHAIATSKMGIKPILGCELYMEAHNHDLETNKIRKSHHLLALAYNQTGWQNLIKLSTWAELENFYYYPLVSLQKLSEYNEGLIITSGCMASIINYFLNPENNMVPNYKMALQYFQAFLDIFGRERFYVEIQDHNIKALARINQTLLGWAKTHNVGLVVTGDVHYAKEEDRHIHDILMCTQMNTNIADPTRLRLQNGYHLMSREEMEQYFTDAGYDLPKSAFDNTVKIGEMVEDYPLTDGQIKFPKLPYELKQTAPDALSALAWQGFKRLGLKGVEYENRLSYELSIVNRLGFSEYFLIVADLKDFADKEGIIWNTRGSAAGCLISYCLGIVNADPIKYGLMFERFLNPDRVSPPDIDIDVPGPDRKTLIDYLAKNYGKDNVAQVVNWTYLKPRSAIRDVTRATLNDISLGDTLAKMVPESQISKVYLEDVLTEGHQHYSGDLAESYRRSENVKTIIDYSRDLQGVIRGRGAHAAAVIVTPETVDNYAPLVRNASKKVFTKHLVGYNFETCDDLGLLKLDILGVSTLTVISNTIKAINKKYNLSLSFETIPLDDPASYNLICSGHLAGIFQLEGHTAASVVSLIQPRNIQQVTAINALARPGPMQYVPDYADFANGRKTPRYANDEIEKVLKETYSVLVYQEQLIEISKVVAGFSNGEADKLRKACAKKKGLPEMERQFIDGGISNGYASEFMTKLWADILPFSAYCFNKSHALVYSIVSVTCAYLKAHYPLEFYAECLSIRFDKEEKMALVLEEIRDRGIEVLPPDITKSKPNFTVEGDAIRFGLAPIKGFGPKQVGYFNKLKEIPESVTDIHQLSGYIKFKRVGKTALTNLIKVGAFERFSSDREFLLGQVSNMVKGVITEYQQGSFLDDWGLKEDKEAIEIFGYDIFSDQDENKDIALYLAQKELIGFYLSGHPTQIDGIKDKLKIKTVGPINSKYQADQFVRIGGIVSGLRVHLTKKGDYMATLELEDWTGKIIVRFFPEDYERLRSRLTENCFAIINGTISQYNGQKQLIGRSFQILV